MKTKIPKKTVNQACCMYCERPFIYASALEIFEHMNMPISLPFKTGTVYVSPNGFNIITHRGKLVDGLIFPEQSIHDYIHQVATAKIKENIGICFEDNLKTRTVLELEERFNLKQIRVPSLVEILYLQKSFSKYLDNEGKENNPAVWNYLKEIKPEDLIGVCKRAFIPSKREYTKINSIIHLEDF